MKAFDLLENIGEIDGKYIMEANELEKMHVKKVSTKRRLMTSLAAVLAICLLSATAYAATLYLGIQDMTKGTYMELPSEATEFIQQQDVQGEGEDWSCRVVESIFDSSSFKLTVGVSGGDKWVVVPTYADPTDKVSLIGLEGEETLEEYAERVGKTLLYVGAALDRELSGTQGQMFKNHSDGEMTILVEGQMPDVTDIKEATCTVYALPDGGINVEDVERVNLTFSIDSAPVSQGRVFVPDNPEAIPGLRVGNAIITETPMGITVEVPEDITDEAKSYDIMKVDSDELTYNQGGSTQGEDGQRKMLWTECKGTVTDTLTLHYYDWDKVLIGTITFHAE